jgi:xylan 1,4-beta-xylosidase
LAVSDEIIGPYKVLTHEKPLAEFPSNDLHLFPDDDGKTYAFFNNGWTNIHKIFVAEIDLEKGKLIEEPVELIKQESGWDGSGIEGAHVIKQDGIYYLFYSSWTKGYAVGYATAKNIRGPWTKSNDNPIFGAYSKDGKNYIFKNGKELQVDQSPYVTLGHNQIFKGPDGNFWTSCHAYTDAGKAWMIMDPIWFEDGKVKTNAPTFTPQTVPVDKKFLKMFPGLKVK